MGVTDHEKYLRTDELLALQKPLDARSCHDELQFRVVHHAHGLYMKPIEHELRFTGQHGALLLHGMKQRLFPTLWDTRDDVFGAWTAAQASKGHDPGYHG